MFRFGKKSAQRTRQHVDVGLNAVQGVFRFLSVDDEWSTPVDRGFVWWPGPLAQYVWAEVPFRDEGFQVSRLHVRTDLFDVVQLDSSQTGLLEAVVKGSSLHGLITTTEETPRLQLASSMYVTAQTADGLGRIISMAAAIQAWEALFLMQNYADRLGFKEATSAPPGKKPRENVDEIVNVVPKIVIPAGKDDSRFTGQRLMDALEMLQEPPCVFATGDENGVAAEFPFADFTSLLQIDTTTPHPWYGNGMTFSLSLPQPLEAETSEGLLSKIMRLNSNELRSLTRCHFLGSWQEESDTLKYVSFFPNSLAVAVDVTYFAQVSMMRAHWVSTKVFKVAWDYTNSFKRKEDRLNTLGLSTSETPDEIPQSVRPLPITQNQERDRTFLQSESKSQKGQNQVPIQQPPVRSQSSLPIAQAVSIASPQKAPGPRTYDRVKLGFDLTLVRCQMEATLRDRVWENEDLLKRIKSLSKEIGESRVQMRLGLLTDSYRVDEAITPKLYRLGWTLTKILRLSHPLDVFVRPSDERNAFCLPSRKGNRLVMLLNSGLLAALTNQELLFVMGHEIGHAILRHGELPSVSFDNPHFSPLEIIQLRALDRAQEISCDRVGLLACQDVRVASTALFKLASGLTERWIAFDEIAYARHFDELSSMAEVVDLEDVSRTHPLVPLRVKALIGFSRSDLYFKVFGRPTGAVSIREVESSVETMLSVLLPDLSELENAEEEKAVGQFLFDGALLVIAADGVVDPGEVAWLESFTEAKWSTQELVERLSSPDFHDELNRRLEENAHILRNKLPERKRAGLLHVMCEVALSAGGIPDTEFEVLNHLRQLLRIRPEIAKSVLHCAVKEHEEGEQEDLEGVVDGDSAGQDDEDASTDPLVLLLTDAKLTENALRAAEQICEEIRGQDVYLDEAIRSVVSWAIVAAKRGGPLTKAQSKRIAISAVRLCRALREQAGSSRRRSGTAMDRRIRESGVVVLFQKGENVTRVSDGRHYVVLSVSPTRGRIKIALLDDPGIVDDTDPHDLTKDPTNGYWHPELGLST